MITTGSFSDWTLENGQTVSLDGLPPAPVVWCYNALDIACIPLRCRDWREYFSLAKESSWFSEQYRVPTVASVVPALLTYDEFRVRHVAAGEPWLTSNALCQYAFHTPSTALGSLNEPTALAVLFVVVVLLRQLQSVVLPYFRAFGRQAATRTHGAAWVQENEIRITKFGEYVFRLFYHSTMSMYGVFMFYGEPWWRPKHTADVLLHFPMQEISPVMAWYYMLQAAYNVDAFVSLLMRSFTLKFTWGKQDTSTGISRWRFPIQIGWRPDVRGDFQEMFIHHFATNMLVVLSSIFRLTGIGSIIFLVHDLSDIPVDLSKLANFMKWKTLTIIAFFTMAAVWFGTRLYILPRAIFWTAVTKSHYILQTGLVSPLQFILYRHVLYFFLALLIWLHFLWFLMFLRMFYTLATKNECHDYSEHKKGEVQSGTSAKGTTRKKTK